MSNRLHWILFSILAVVLINCSDPTAIGTDLLEQDLVEVGFTDTLTLNSKTMTPRRTLTFTPPIIGQFNTSTFNQPSTYLFGNLQDPIFGNTKSEIYVQPEKQSNAFDDQGNVILNPDFSDSTLDSIVLVLPYDTNSFYGSFEQQLEIEIYRLTEQPMSQDYFTDQTFAFRPTPIATKSFRPSLDSVEVILPIASENSFDTLKLVPQLRIPLPNELGEELIDLDTSFYSDDDAFFDYFKGLYFKTNINNSGLVGFLLNRAVGGMEVYYKQRDTAQVYQFGFYTDAVRTTNITHDHNDAIINSFLSSTATSDSLIFVQGAAGTLGKIVIPNISQFEDAIINKAELEISLANLPQDDTSTYKPIEQLSFYQTLNDGTLEPLEDLSIIITGSAQSRTITIETFGGGLEEVDEDTPNRYLMNITAAVQEMVNNNIKNEILITGLASQSRATSVNSLSGSFENDVIIGAFSSLESPNRSVIFGANHPQYPMKLNITFSKP